MPSKYAGRIMRKLDRNNLSPIRAPNRSILTIKRSDRLELHKDCIKYLRFKMKLSDHCFSGTGILQLLKTQNNHK